MKIHFIGDVHGHFDLLRQVIARNKSDLHVQVGDFGVFPKLGVVPSPTMLGLKQCKVLFIDGNHDDYSSLSEELIELPAQLEFCKRGASTTFNGLTFAFCGGGFSIDKDSRIEGRDWFPNEEPSYQELQDFADAAEYSDILVTHEPPLDFLLHMRTDLSAKASSSTAKSLQHVDDGLKNRPNLWICGHLHPTTVTQWFHNGTVYICIPPIHGPLEGMAMYTPSDGVIINFSKFWD